jgi:hypothetical protein
LKGYLVFGRARSWSIRPIHTTSFPSRFNTKRPWRRFALGCVYGLASRAMRLIGAWTSPSRPSCTPGPGSPFLATNLWYSDSCYLNSHRTASTAHSVGWRVRSGLFFGATVNDVSKLGWSKCTGTADADDRRRATLAPTVRSRIAIVASAAEAIAGPVWRGSTVRVEQQRSTTRYLHPAFPQFGFFRLTWIRTYHTAAQQRW